MMRGLRRWRSSQKRSEWDGAHSRRFSCWVWESQIADHEKFQDESNDKTVQVNLVERKRISKSMKCIHPVVDQQKNHNKCSNHNIDVVVADLPVIIWLFQVFLIATSTIDRTSPDISRVANAVRSDTATQIGFDNVLLIKNA